MPIPATVGAFAIVPSNDLPVAVSFWNRLGFDRTGGDAQYIIMTGWGCEVHLTQAGEGPWRVPENHNPFGAERLAGGLDRRPEALLVSNRSRHPRARHLERLHSDRNRRA